MTRLFHPGGKSVVAAGSSGYCNSLSVNFAGGALGLYLLSLEFAVTLAVVWACINRGFGVGIAILV